MRTFVELGARLTGDRARRHRVLRVVREGKPSPEEEQRAGT